MEEKPLIQIMTEKAVAVGTLMLASDSEEIRIATMLSKIHIAMLPISKTDRFKD